MKDNKKITPTKKKASKETQAMAVRKAGDKGYNKGFKAGKLESADTIKELQAQASHTHYAHKDEHKDLIKNLACANLDVMFWQFMTGITTATVIMMTAYYVLG